MSAILDRLPAWYYLISFVVFLLALVLVALKGKVLIKWGKQQIGIGGNSEDKDKKSNSSVIPPIGHPPETTMVNPVKRSCGDCILILMGEREKYELNMRMMSNKTLKNQMNYAEQRLLDIQNILDKCFDARYDSIEKPGSYEVQYKLYYGLVSTALIKIKDEIRRSFKENGFFELSDKDFTEYVRGKLRSLIQMLNRNLKTVYPSTKDGLTISIEDILAGIEIHMQELNDIMFDVYVRGKEIVIETENEIKDLENRFSKWVDNFIE